MLFDGDGLTYTDMKGMDIAEYNECVAAKELFLAHLRELREKS